MLRLEAEQIGQVHPAVPACRAASEGIRPASGSPVANAVYEGNVACLLVLAVDVGRVATDWFARVRETSTGAVAVTGADRVGRTAAKATCTTRTNDAAIADNP